MDPLHFCVALGPLAVYLVLLGLINLSSRPFLTTGTRDMAALAVAVSGFMVVGPMRLFLPEATLAHFGVHAWLMSLILYGLLVTMVVLFMRPRLVIYNMPVEQLRPLLAAVVADLDPAARWAGESIALPGLGIQLHVEPSGVLRNTQLVAAGPQQNYDGWRRLEVALAQSLRQTRTGPNPAGVSMASLGAAMMLVIVYWTVRDPQTVAETLRNMLRI